MKSIQYNEQLCLAVINGQKNKLDDAVICLKKADQYLDGRQEPCAYRAVIELMISSKDTLSD